MSTVSELVRQRHDQPELYKLILEANWTKSQIMVEVKGWDVYDKDTFRAGHFAHIYILTHTVDTHLHFTL